MARDIDTYLAELRTELTGADPAVAQDALYDAEEFLRTELAEWEQVNPPATAEARAVALDSIIERYGSPQEIAAAYRETPLPRPASTSAPAPAKRDVVGLLLGVVTDWRTWTSLVYLLLALGTGIAYFTTVVTGVSLSAGLSILIIGVPFILFFLGVVRVLSLLEGRIVEVLLGVRMPRRPPLGPRETGLINRILYWLRDRRTWTTMLYMVLQLPLGIAYFATFVALLSTGAYLVAAPVLQAVTGHSYVQFGDTERIFEPWTFPFLILGGLVLLLATLHLARLVGKAHGYYAKALLVKYGQRESAASGLSPSQAQ